MAAGTKPGYTIDRDTGGLTARERQVLGLLVTGMNGPQVAAEIGVTKQRVDQILKSLVKKGRLQKQSHEYVVIVPRGEKE